VREKETRIHPSAVVGPGAEFDNGVEVGPYAVIGPKVRIGKNTWIGPHAVIEGNTTIGKENRIFQFASVGAIPQDLKYQGEESALIIGDHNTIREFATLNPGTTGGGMITRVGDHNLFMVYSHVAHDCQVGNYTVVANSATLGGHVVLEDYVIVGGLVGIHQFVRVGESAILGAGAMVPLDIPPYCNATGDRARLYGLNLVGLKRRGFSTSQVAGLKKAYHALFLSNLSLAEALEQVRTKLASSVEVSHLVEFIESSQRGICRPRKKALSEDEGELL